MSKHIDIKGIKYTLTLTVVLTGFQVACCVLTPDGRVDNHYPSVFKTFENYWDAESYYADIYRYQTGRRVCDGPVN